VLVIGVCSGVPYRIDDMEEVLVGDIIISSAAIEYDFGRQLPDQFIRKATLQDILGRPNTEIR